LSEATVGPETAVLQRAETAPAPEIPTAAPTEAGDEGKKPEAEVDIDKLAREVYSELKHRLSIEWERLRGRYDQNW
jgi:hypothetical protein